jgi:hypothetical protein
VSTVPFAAAHVYIHTASGSKLVDRSNGTLTANKSDACYLSVALLILPLQCSPTCVTRSVNTNTLLRLLTHVGVPGTGTIWTSGCLLLRAWHEWPTTPSWLEQR